MLIIFRTKQYEKACRKLFSDAELAQSEAEIITDPAAWPMIQGSGGIQKARSALAGKGKRGGARIIYFCLAEHKELYFLTAYKKNEREDLSPLELQAWKAFIEMIKKEKDNARAKEKQTEKTKH